MSETARIPAQSLRRRNVVLLALSYPIVCVLLWITLRENSFFALAHLLATALSFWMLIAASIVLLGVIWIALGLDLKIWWVPSTYNEWNLIFWGLFIYLITLPSAFLVWREPDRADDLELQDV